LGQGGQALQRDQEITVPFGDSDISTAMLESVTGEKSMKVQELLADLQNRTHQGAQVLVVETGDADNIFTIESTVKEDNEKTVLLMAKSVRPRTLIEALGRGAGQIHNMKIYESVEHPGKFQGSIDGLALLQHFETQANAKLFIQGYTFGFTAGLGSR
jgi:hypothetical protein